MTRLIIPALVALLVSGPAWAAEDDAILLHCSGSILVHKNWYGAANNIKIEREGKWIIWNVKKNPRTFATKRRKTVQGGVHPPMWTYEFQNKIGEKESIHFNPNNLWLAFTSENVTKFFACFPIKNPLKY